ncbi:copper chaperone PCu(A)C [Streptomyces sp. NPDC006265]|uniref:copper chaperone PCu(A)C n=1 Tax=Streptomyces sp. NPDC006265 TaxID=3156740 RepID=UPI0033A8DB62
MALFRRGITRGRTALLTAALLALTSCGSEEGFDPQEWDAPGQNGKVGSMLVRYAHMAEPRGEPWQPGDDVPVYMWLYNKGPDEDRLVGASTPVARSVEIVDGQGEPVRDGVSIPVDDLQGLESDATHLVLRDLRQTVRGGEFVEFTVRFEKSGNLDFKLPAQIPAYESDAPSTG